MKPTYVVEDEVEATFSPSTMHAEMDVDYRVVFTAGHGSTKGPTTTMSVILWISKGKCIWAHTLMDEENDEVVVVVVVL